MFVVFIAFLPSVSAQKNTKNSKSIVPGPHYNRRALCTEWWKGASVCSPATSLSDARGLGNAPRSISQMYICRNCSLGNCHNYVARAWVDFRTKSHFSRPLSVLFSFANKNDDFMKPWRWLFWHNAGKMCEASCPVLKVTWTQGEFMSSRRLTNHLTEQQLLMFLSSVKAHYVAKVEPIGSRQNMKH